MLSRIIPEEHRNMMKIYWFIGEDIAMFVNKEQKNLGVIESEAIEENIFHIILTNYHCHFMKKITNCLPT